VAPTVDERSMARQPPDLGNSSITLKCSGPGADVSNIVPLPSDMRRTPRRDLPLACSTRPAGATDLDGELPTVICPTDRLRGPGASRRALVTALLTVLALLVAAVPAGAAPRTAGARATHIVEFRAGIGRTAAARIVRAAGGQPGAALPLIRGLGARLSRRAAVRLARDPRVRAVTRNGRVAPQARRVDASALASSYPRSVLAPASWSVATGRGVTVAVIDTGIDGANPDLEAADGSSRVIGSAVVNPLAASAEDRYGHGTHVAGIIAGDGTRRGVGDPERGRYIGIAPEANLVSVKIADDNGGATVLDAIYGLQFVVDHRDDYGIRVVNLSLESTVARSYRTDPLDAAVEAAWFAGIVVVAAAGNRGSGPDAVQHAPGNDPYAITVGAVDDKGTPGRADDAVAPWSGRGTTQDGFAKPDVTAPGSRIVSVLPAGSAYARLCPTCVVGQSYIRAGGTSMAAPVVSGIAALMLQAHPTWTPDQVKQALRRSAEMVGSPIGEVSAIGVLLSGGDPASAEQGLVPNGLVDPATGAIDYDRSSWSRSSWSGAPGSLAAGWARSSWSCDCSRLGGGAVDPARSSWSRSSWSTRWGG
jgi:serine protease AprX